MKHHLYVAIELTSDRYVKYNIRPYHHVTIERVNFGGLTPELVAKRVAQQYQSGGYYGVTYRWTTTRSMGQGVLNPYRSGVQS